MKSSVIKRNIDSILCTYQGNGYISIKDIYNNHSVNDIISGKFTDDVCSYCDDNCYNGHFSRWTNFGVDLVNDAIDFTNKIVSLKATF